jgi:serine phosphatase RsbU (regulator of sigma subunit)
MLSYFYPKNIENNIETQRKAALFVIVVLLMAAFSLAYLLICYFAGIIVGVYTNVIMLPLLILALRVFKRTGSFVYGANIAAFGLSAGICEGVLFSGNLTSPAILWLIVVPTVAFLLGSKRSGIAWSASISAAFIGFAAVTILHWNLPYLLPRSSEDYVRAFTLVAVTAWLAVVIITYENTKNRALSLLTAKNEELAASEQHLASELAAGASYVRSLLPSPFQDRIGVDWRFQPSAELGGDAFGYHWLGKEQLAIYLLDVSGHGMSAALLSISVLNVIRTQSLAGADFANPASVLSQLNRSFRMEQHNSLLFTMWYGVLDTAVRQITFASGGHPPAVLLEPINEVSFRARQLSTRGVLLGLDPDAVFRNDICNIGRGSKLYVFSDGVYEISKPDGQTQQLADFVQQLSQPVRKGAARLDAMLNWAQALRGSDALEDDFSLIELALQPASPV